jgi:hypothetical protein
MRPAAMGRSVRPAPVPASASDPLPRNCRERGSRRAGGQAWKDRCRAVDAGELPRIGNQLHCRVLVSARGAELRGLQSEGCVDDGSVCWTVLVGKTVGQPIEGANLFNYLSILRGYGGGEGGTRTLDLAIMSRAL